MSEKAVESAEKTASQLEHSEPVLTENAALSEEQQGILR
jgi:hypothetical protein